MVSGIAEQISGPAVATQASQRGEVMARQDCRRAEGVADTGRDDLPRCTAPAREKHFELGRANGDLVREQHQHAPGFGRQRGHAGSERARKPLAPVQIDDDANAEASEFAAQARSARTEYDDAAGRAAGKRHARHAPKQGFPAHTRE